MISNAIDPDLLNGIDRQFDSPTPAKQVVLKTTEYNAVLADSEPNPLMNSLPGPRTDVLPNIV
jgi:hypothetical protein